MTGPPFVERLLGGRNERAALLAAPDLARPRTYRQLAAGADEVARVLVGRHGLERGDPVALLLPRGAALVETLLGVLAAGGAVVPLPIDLPPPEVADRVESVRPRLVVSDAGHAHRVGAGVVVVLAPELRGRSSRTPRPAGDDVPALILHTSGTTARPKGVVLSRAAVAATLGTLARAWRWRRSDVLLHALPLHHTHGLVVAMMGALWSGAALRVVPFAAEPVWDALHGSSVFMGVPTMYGRLVEAWRVAGRGRRAGWRAAGFAMRLFTSGSAPLSPALFRSFGRATGHAIVERYGMTEIGMALSNRYEGPRVPGSVGPPLPRVRVDIVDEAGLPVEDGQSGELRVRSPQLFSGYLGDSAATRAAFDDAGRFRTGDVGVWVAQGTRRAVRLLGRASTDIIKSGGEKVSALEVEQAIAAHPAVADVAVIGMPDPDWGEQVTACVVLRAGATLDLVGLRAHAKRRVAPWKVPRALVVLGELPRNAMGKVDKRALQDRIRARASGSGTRR